MRTLPWVATTYALRITGRVMRKMHMEMEHRMSSGAVDDTAALLEKEVHAVGSCLKAVCTTFTVDGVEELRRACGGHGFTMFSGLQDLYGNAMVNFTGEGENYMLIQQGSQALLRVYQHVEAHAEDASGSPNFRFIKSAAQLDDSGNALGEHVDLLGAPLEAFVQAFEHRAARKLAVTAEAGQGHAAPLQGPAQWEGIQAAWAFGEMLVLKGFVQGIRELEAQQKPMGPSQQHGASAVLSVAGVLSLLCRLFAMDLMSKHLQDWLIDGSLTREQALNVPASVKVLLAQVRPMAVSLVDAMAFSDYELNSAIGRSDGRVYETLLEWAQLDPMNKGAVIEGFDLGYGRLLRAGREKLLQKSGHAVEEFEGIVQQSGSPPRARL